MEVEAKGTMPSSVISVIICYCYKKLGMGADSMGSDRWMSLKSSTSRCIWGKLIKIAELTSGYDFFGTEMR